MKCEKCNEREATFFYTATVNGETTQSRLCLGCARDLGLTTAFERPLFEDFGFFGGPFFREPFALLDSFFSPRPARAVIAERAARSETGPAAARIPQNAGGEFKARREMIALKHQLKAAVRDENFERAIELRDQIKTMENGD